jgi:hypothetical protein
MIPLAQAHGQVRVSPGVGAHLMALREDRYYVLYTKHGPGSASATWVQTRGEGVKDRPV